MNATFKKLFSGFVRKPRTAMPLPPYAKTNARYFLSRSLSDYKQLAIPFNCFYPDLSPAVHEGIRFNGKTFEVALIMSF